MVIVVEVVAFVVAFTIGVKVVEVPVFKLLLVVRVCRSPAGWLVLVDGRWVVDGLLWGPVVVWWRVLWWVV